jgi:WXG100 family type VII secretion target
MALAAGNIDESANLIRGLQVQIEGHKNEMRAGWEGNASLAFEQVFERFNTDFSKVLKAMDSMHEALVQTHINYTSKEQDAKDAVNRINQMLNG